MNTPAPTAEQQAVIDARTGTVLVLAAVGSGKTTTLSHRIAADLADGVPPERVLALTFTNRAAEHLRRGVAGAIGDAAAAALAPSTFHALCNRILRDHAGAAGLPSDFRILDEEDTEELLRELGVSNARGAMYALGKAASMVPLGEASVEMWTRGAFSNRDEARPFVEGLLQRGAIDFGGLVLLTRALLLRDPDCRASWGQRYRSVLVDEVQDTHLSEYEVLSVLAREARSFCLVGDLDQTIYSWRGSAPRKLIAALERDFGPVRRLELTASFRATRALLAVADRVAAGLEDRESRVTAAPSADPGVPPTLHAFDTDADEFAFVADRAAAAVADGEDPRRMAVLVRTNQQVTAASEALAAAGVPCTTIEQFRFFRRAEVKDALALARLVADRSDEQAARRVMRRLVKGVGPRTVREVLDDLAGNGLRMADLLDTPAVQAGDPLWGLSAPEVVVLDTETTGVDPSVDEIIEVAAQRVRGGVPVPGADGRFEALVKNTRPLGDSEAVHGISQARIDADGRDPGQVLTELRRFIGDAPIAGHNVGFDAAMLRAAGDRAGVDLELQVAWDSLDLARRLVRTDRYTLGHLVEHLGIPYTPTHRALDDVLATVSLGERLARLAQTHAAARRSATLRQAARFGRLRQTLDRWAEDALRPHELVARITAEALRFKYPSEPHRIAHLAELATRLEALDDPSLRPGVALSRVLTHVALVRDVDQLDQADGVRVITMHQSKGLEFDRVWLPGMTDGGLPGWMALKDGTPAAIDEERRVFYVALTRARRALHLTWSRRNARGYATPPSRFLDGLRDLLDPHEAGP